MGVWCRVLVGLGVVACHDAKEEQLKALERMVAELKGQQQRTDAKVADLSDRLMVMDSQPRYAQAEPETPTGLTVVKLGPTPPRAAKAPPRRDEVVDVDLRGYDDPDTLTIVPVAKPPAHTVKQEDKALDAAMAHIREGAFDKAASALSAFLSRSPQDANADKALYWLGEAEFERQRYDAAIDAFARLKQQFPKSSKGAEGLYKLALAQSKAGRHEVAKATFTEVTTRYPQSAMSELAAHKLASYNPQKAKE